MAPREYDGVDRRCVLRSGRDAIAPRIARADLG
jgi:hypothetical protein